MDRYKKYLLFAYVVLMVIPFLYVILAYPFLPTTDGAGQLQAALRMLEGNGYTVSLIPQNDLSLAHYIYLKGYPAGYSFILLLMMKAGLTLEVAAKVFQCVILTSVLMIWCYFSFRYIKTGFARFAFLSMFCPLAMRMSYCVTDGVLCVIFPIVTMLVLATRDDKKRLINILAAGILIAFAVFVKYLGLVILFIGILWLIFIHRKDFRSAVKYVITLSVLPVITTVAIFYTNCLYGKSIWMSAPTLEKGLNLGLRPFEILYGMMYAIITPGFISRIITRSGLGTHNQLIQDFLAVGITLSLIYVIYKLYRSGRLTDLIEWFVISFVSMIVFFGLLNVFLLPKGFRHIFFSEGRYYFIIIPIIFIFIAEYIAQDVKRYVIVSLSIIMLLAGIGGSLMFSRHMYLRNKVASTSINEVLGIISSTREFNKAEAVAIISSDPRYMVTFEKQKVPVYAGIPDFSTRVMDFEIIDIAFTDKTFISKPTLVFVIYEDPVRPRAKHAELLSRLSFKKENYSIGSVYWREFKPGKLFKDN